MLRRLQVALAMLVIAAATVVHAESAQERACARDGVTRLAPARAELLALFARPAVDRESRIVESKDGSTAPMGPAEVVIARIGSDGKPVIACVNSEAAAIRFLDASPENLPAKKKEQ